MSSDAEDIAKSLVNAVKNNHIPSDTSAILDHVLSENSAPSGTQTALKGMIEEINGSLDELNNDILHAVSLAFDDDFSSVYDIIKGITQEITKVDSLFGDVQQDNVLASLELTEFANNYREYEACKARSAEIDATLPLLSELKEMFAKVKGLEDDLASDFTIEDIEWNFGASIGLDPGLKIQDLPLSINSRLRSHIETLEFAAREKAKGEWNRSVLIGKTENGVRISILNNILIRLCATLEKNGDLEELIITFKHQFIADVVRPIIDNRHASAQIQNGDLLIEPRNGTEEAKDLPLPHLENVFKYISRLLPPSAFTLLKSTAFTELITTILRYYLREQTAAAGSLHATIELFNELNKILVMAHWPYEVNGQRWLQQVPRLWLANRRASLLSELRSVFHHSQSHHQNTLITKGIDILTEPKFVEVTDIGGPLECENIATADVEDDHEPDGWGFNGGDDELDEGPAENGEEDEDTVDDAWNTWDDDIDEATEPEETSSNAFPYVVSSILDGLMDVVERIVSEGEQILAPSNFVLSNFSPQDRVAVQTVGKEFPTIVASAMGTWRALSHFQWQAGTYGQRMCQSNDALYLSHRFVPHAKDPAIARTMQELLRCGNRLFDDGVNHSRNELLKALETADGLRHTGNSAQATKSSQAIESVIRNLKIISKEYRETLPPQKYLIAIGQLVSSILLYMNTSLAAMKDISAAESTFLVGLYTMIFTLEELFVPLEAREFVAEWIKAQYVRELLEWRMVDIMDSWREGLLQGVFTADEMAGWLCKLFQESDSRARNIAEIVHA